jgi:acyl carrier protein
MDKQELSNRVVKVVCEVLSIDKDMVNPSSNFVFDLGAESTQSVQLMAGFEEEFGIELGEDALEVQTVEGAIEFIGKLVK